MKLIALTASILIAAAPAFAAEGIAKLTGPGGAELGTARLTTTPHGVLITVDVAGLTPGAHGFHIHENGTCAPDFDAAGDHYNPGGKDHGIMVESGRHAGDLPNIYASPVGAARADILTDTVSLDASAENTVFDDNGSALIIHENPDSYGEDAKAGGRMICGVIELN